MPDFFPTQIDVGLLTFLFTHTTWQVPIYNLITRAPRKEHREVCKRLFRPRASLTTTPWSQNHYRSCFTYAGTDTRRLNKLTQIKQLNRPRVWSKSCIITKPLWQLKSLFLDDLSCSLDPWIILQSSSNYFLICRLVSIYELKR